MNGTWIHALLDLIVLGALAALIQIRHLGLKKDQLRLRDELEQRIAEKHQLQIQFARESREWIAASLSIETGRLDSGLRQTLQRHIDAITQNQGATEQLSSGLARQLSEANRNNLYKICDEIHSISAAQSQYLIEHVQACSSGLETFVQERLSEEFTAISDLLLHKMGKARCAAIDEVFDRLDKLRKRDPRFSGFIIDRERQMVTLGQVLHFETGSHQLGREQARILRAYLVQVLEIADSPQAQKWLNRVSVSGSGDGHGTYLFNLNLGLQRSQRILSVLLSPSAAGEMPLDSKELEIVQRLFAVNYHPAGSRKTVPDDPAQLRLHFDFLTELP